jgi:predicted N-acyltransferase
MLRPEHPSRPEMEAMPETERRDPKRGARPHPVKQLARKVGDARSRHRERHRPTGFGFAFADSIHYVDPTCWDRVTAGSSVFLGRAYLAAVEDAGPTTIRGRYALIFRAREPVAAVAAQVVQVTGGRLARAKSREARGADAASRHGLREAIARAAVKVRSGALGKIHAQLLVCGNLLSWGQHGVAFAPGVDPLDIWPAIAEALYRIRRAEKLLGQTSFVLVKDTNDEEAKAASALERFSYRSLETDPNMVLEIHPAWKRYEDYLASLQSKYRRTAVKIGSDFDAAGLRLATLDDLEPHAGAMHGLYLQVHGEAKVRLATLPPSWFPTLAVALGKDFRCIAAFRGEQMLGFVTLIRDGETAVGYYIGFDRPANAEAPIYFRLLEALIDGAIQLGCRRLSLGRTALEPKARLGAKPVPLRVWIRHRVPVMNLVVRNLLRLVSHDEAPERSPFK